MQQGNKETWGITFRRRGKRCDHKGLQKEKNFGWGEKGGGREKSDFWVEASKAKMAPSERTPCGKKITAGDAQAAKGGAAGR